MFLFRMGGPRLIAHAQDDDRRLGTEAVVIDPPQLPARLGVCRLSLARYAYHRERHRLALGEPMYAAHPSSAGTAFSVAVAYGSTALSNVDVRDQARSAARPPLARGRVLEPCQFIDSGQQQPAPRMEWAEMEGQVPAP